MAESEAGKWELWFREVLTKVGANPEDVNADEELHLLNEWLHQYENQRIIGGVHADEPCVHCFADGSAFSCANLKQVPPAQAEKLALAK